MENDKIFLSAFNASIANQECLDKKLNSIYKIKYFFWYMMLIFISPYKKFHDDYLAFAVTPISLNRVKDFYKGNIFCLGRMNSKISNMRKNISMVSPYSVIKRIILTLNGTKFYIKHYKKVKKNFGIFLEYFAINEYIKKHSPKKVIYSGMYDRYCTFITNLAKEYGIETIGVQDGAAIDINVPYKVYCDKMYAFDEFEAETIKKFMLNKDCEYIYTGFISYLKWETYDKKGKKVIAVASQDWFTDKTKELVRAIANKLDTEKYELIVYPHYRETKSQYDDIMREFPQIKIITDVRHSNIDLLITFYSTIVYDFWSVNKNLPVICLHLKGYEANYYKRNNVYVAENICDVCKKLKEIISEN